MIELLAKSEAMPEAYPDPPAGLSTAAAALSEAMLWQRIEAYIAHRWTPREVTWTVSGSGDWAPFLTPATITASEIWLDHAWSTVTLNASPLGGYELEDATYRFTATVGDVSPSMSPEVVLEAYRRLAEYSAETARRHGSSSWEIEIGALRERVDRAPAWMAKALQNSGAADLLRPYRRV
ncbi:hypothetical protein KUV64_11840 [Mameliella alba]|uniref:hypothetical protein n=1 Tax=Mameliella alba TaxID=561184 RepID=UPI001C946724|nr:hypothetical protein [Mameliella alba]MBY6119821.1 hypothetical protein [Mameliella alba]